LKGYLYLWRKLADSPLWLSEPFTRGQAWVDMLILANHKDGFIRVRGVRVAIKRGQLAWSQLSLASRWKWSRGKCRRFLSELESEKELKIVQQNSKVTSLITILNYTYHQSGGTTGSTTNGQQTDNKRYTNKNGKNGNKEPKGSMVPKEFPVTVEMKDWFFKQEFQSLEIKSATDEWHDYWLGIGGVKGIKKDWIATWRNGMRKAEKWERDKAPQEETWRTNFLK
jgi:hypothetical protein